MVCSRVIIAAAAVGKLACANGGWRKGAVGKRCRGRMGKGRDLYKERSIYKYRIYPHQVYGGAYTYLLLRPWVNPPKGDALAARAKKSKKT